MPLQDAIETFLYPDEICCRMKRKGNIIVRGMALLKNVTSRIENIGMKKKLAEIFMDFKNSAIIGPMLSALTKIRLIDQCCPMAVSLQTFHYSKCSTDEKSLLAEVMTWRLPSNTLGARRNNNVIITSKRRRFDVMMTLVLRRVPTGWQTIIWTNHFQVMRRHICNEFAHYGWVKPCGVAPHGQHWFM